MQACAVRQVAAADQESIFDPLAERGDFRGVQAGAVCGQHDHGHGIEQTRAVSG